MLLMWRHAGESIFIGEGVELSVLECGPNRVKLGIRAPQSVAIVRGEVKQTRDQNLAAARSMGTNGLIARVAGARTGRIGPPDFRSGGKPV